MEAQVIYDKLYWGCNLPSMTPPGMHDEPIWSREEITTVVAVLHCGLRMLRDAIGHAPKRVGSPLATSTTIGRKATRVTG